MRPAFPAVLSVLALTLAPPAAAQITVEAHGGAAYTTVDIEQWARRPVTGSEQVGTVGRLQVYFLERSGVQVGAELGYARLLSYQEPFGSTTRTVDVRAHTVSGVAQRRLSPLFVAQVAAGFYSFVNGASLIPGVGAGLGARIPITDRLSLPLKLRADFIMDTATVMIPVGLSLGLSIDLGGRSG